MAGILRHFFIAIILTVVLFLILRASIQFPQLVLFFIGNVIPDFIFAPFFILKYKTFDAEKIIKKKEWKIVSNQDEIITFIIAVCLFFLFISYDTFIFLFGVTAHIFIDFFVLEENVWW